MKQSSIPYRNHHSGNPILSLYNREQKNFGQMKPNGLWYSFNWYWLENLELGLDYHEIDYTPKPDKIYNGCNYLYELIIDEDNFTTLKEFQSDKILRLCTKDDYEHFADMYNFKPQGYVSLDWNRVANKFAGIEFPNWNKVQALQYFHLGRVTFLYGLDIPCGCIWKVDRIKTFNMVHQVSTVY